MKRRDAIKGLGAAGAALLCGQAGAQAKRPNILFIMSDDHATNAVSCYGGRLAGIAPTPNIDRIARQGARLDACFCTNSICTPSRASILTGQYSHKNGVYTLADALDPARPNVAKELQAAGYETAIIGKWHLKTEPAGFDYWNVLPGQGRYHQPVMKEIGGESKTHEGHSTDVVTDQALAWLDRRGDDKPFFLKCHFKAPHEPWDYAPRYRDYLEDVEIPEPDSLFEDLSHRSDGSREYGFTIDTMAERQTREGYHSEGAVDFSGLDERERRKKAYQIFLKRYLRTIRGVDDNIGRILDYLDENGLAEDTLVIYTSDQGYFLGEHNYIDKRWMFEESLRMPFVARWPGRIAPGTVSDDIALNIDFAPAFLDAAGESTPDYMQGRSLLPLLEGDTPADWRESMYYRYWLHVNRPAHYGVRTQRYKLIFFYGLPLGMNGAQEKPSKPGWELYDLARDPNELNNVYDNPAYQDVVTRLTAELDRLKEQYDDTDEQYPQVRELRGM